MGRLSRITTATAVAGTFATVGFGGLAAITYSGTSSPADTTDQTTDGSQSTDTQALTSPGTTKATSAPNSATTTQQAPTVRLPTTTRGRSHASTGGSG